MNEKIALNFCILLTLFFIKGNLSAQDDIPRPEHPRPQFKRDRWMNLNGQWNFAFDPGKSGFAKDWPKDPSSIDKEITVPFCIESKLSGIEHTDFMPMVWYHRTVDIPEDWKDQRIFLHFGAVDYECRAWVNGKEVGRHYGGSVSFSFEITDALKEGENDIVVRARDEIRSDVQPAGKQSFRYKSFGVYYTCITGIWQTVWLEARPESFIKRVNVVPKLDESQFVVIPTFDRAGRNYTFRTILSTPDGERLETVTSSAVNGKSVVINIDDPHPWSLDDPYLYDLDFELVEAGKTIDHIDSYAGLRKFHIEGNTFYLNNEPIFLRFVLDQGYYPKGLWTAPTDEALKEDIERAKRVGFNGARLHQKVFEPRFHYWADKLGYLTWGEFCDWGTSKYRSFFNAETIWNHHREWREVVMRDRNHPSIIAWTSYNETIMGSKNPENHRRAVLSAYNLTRDLDPTRPVNDASGFVHVKTDIYTVHDYDMQPESFRERYSSVDPDKPAQAWKQVPDMSVNYRGQPYMVDEYGGILWTKKHVNHPEKAGKKRHNWGYGKTADQVEDRIEALTEVLLNNPNIAGFTYTQLTDIEQEVNGIYTYDRQLKFDADRLREIFGAPAAIIEE